MISTGLNPVIKTTAMNTSDINSALYLGHKFTHIQIPIHTAYNNPNRKQEIKSLKPLTLLPTVKHNPSVTFPDTTVKTCAGFGVYAQRPSSSRHRAIWLIAGMIWIMLIVQSVAWGQTTLATFNFENNLTPESGAIGSPSLVENSTSFDNGTVCQGSYSLLSNSTGDYVELTISTTGYENISVQWNGRYSGSNDWNGGNQWLLTGDYGTGYGGILQTQNLSTSCNAAQYTLANDFNNNSSIKLRITYTDGGRDGRLDELIVTGDVICIPTAGEPNIFGTNTWNVYAYNGGSIDLSGTTYRGFYAEPNLSFNTTSRWGDLLSPSSASGYQGCSVDVDYFTFVYKRQGFPCGTYQIDVPDHDDEARLYVNGTNVWEHLSCCDSHTNVWTGVLDVNSTVEFRVQDGAANSLGALTFTLIPAAADFSATSTSILQGNNVTFSDLSTGSITTRSWSFPGGTPSTSTDPNPVVTYNTLGTYDVSLTVNSCGSDVAETKTGYITVSALTPCGTAVIWEEPFTGYSTYTNSGTGTTSAGSWISELDPNGTDGVYATGNRLVFEDADANNNDDFNLTLNTAGYSDIEVSVPYGSNSLTNGDNLVFSYSVDGGPFVSYLTVNGTTPDGTASTPTLNGSSVVININAYVDAEGDYYWLDNISVSGTQVAPTVNDPADLAQCAGEATSVDFTGATTYLWTNDNTNIGLDATGIGNISFTTADIPDQEIANLTVTPSNGNCTGTLSAIYHYCKPVTHGSSNRY